MSLPIDLNGKQAIINNDYGTWGEKVNSIQQELADGINELYDDVLEINGLSTGLGMKADLINGKVPLSQMDDSLVGAVEYKEAWDANTNTPILPSTPTEKGIYYVVSVAGTQFGLTFGIGDWIISNGTIWQKLDATLNAEDIAQILADAVLTGNPTAPNPSLSDSDTSIATTAFVKGVAGNKYTFDTVAEMETYGTLNPFSTGDTIQLLGYYSKNDGAGHYRKIENTDDGSGIAVGSLWANLINYQIYNVDFFGCDGVDDTVYIQKALDYLHTIGGGFLQFSKKIYKISSTLKIKLNTIVSGIGAGAYFAGTGYDRLTVIQPIVGFSGTDIVRIDPSDVNIGLVYSYGSCVRNLLFDLINVKDDEKITLKLLSLSNAENFENIRFVNNNNGIDLFIGISDNVSASKPDGLNFSNIYTLPRTNSINTLNPRLKIESGNEISFRDSKFQNSVTPLALVDSKSVHISAKENTKVSAITFDSCSFTGSESGIFIESKSTDGEGARWIRVNNSTFEGLSYGIRAKGVSTRPVQFCTFGTGNRFITTSVKDIYLEEYSNNNIIMGDESTSVELKANSRSNNVLFCSPTDITDKGTENNVVYNDLGKLNFEQNIENWITPTLTSSWVSNTASRTTAQYRKDKTQGKVILKGYLTGGIWGYPNYCFQLPLGYYPSRGMEFSIASGNGTSKFVVLNNGYCYFVGGTGEAVIDGIEFYV